MNQPTCAPRPAMTDKALTTRSKPPPQACSGDEPNRLTAQIMGMLSSFPSQAMSQAMAEARLSNYFDVLAPFPLAIVRQAIAFWMGRRHTEGNENYAFPPSPPQLVRLARIAAEEALPPKPVGTGHRYLPPVPDIPEPTPEQKERVLRLLRETSRKLATDKPRDVRDPAMVRMAEEARMRRMGGRDDGEAA